MPVASPKLTGEWGFLSSVQNGELSFNEMLSRLVKFTENMTVLVEFEHDELRTNRAWGFVLGVGKGRSVRVLGVTPVRKT